MSSISELKREFYNIFSKEFTGGTSKKNVSFILNMDEENWVLVVNKAYPNNDEQISITAGQCIFSVKENKIIENSLEFVYDLEEDYQVINGELAALFAINYLKNAYPYTYREVLDKRVFPIRYSAEEPFSATAIRCLLRLCLSMPLVLERTIKTSPNAIKNKWYFDECGLSEVGKKLPANVNDWAVKQKNSKSLVDFLQFVCDKEDGNNTVILMDYFKACIRIDKTTSKKKYNAHDDSFYENLYAIMKADDSYSSKKLIEYLIRQSFYYNDFCNQFEEAYLLRDYIEYAQHIGIPFEKYPSNIYKAHNIMIRNSKSPKLSEKEIEMFKAVCEGAKKYEVSFKDYCVVIPDTPEDLLHEGVSLNHCVAGYASRIAHNETIIGFLRKKNNISESLYTIEIKDNKIVQIKGAFNADPPEEINDVVKNIERKW